MAPQGDVIRRHPAAGGFVGVSQERDDLVGIFHVRQGTGGVGGREIAQDVGGLIRLHLVEHVRQAIG
jgi:hypothetical protein